MKKVIITMGVPGSGKTTLMKAFVDRLKYAEKYVYISPDEIRKEKYGNEPFDASKNPEVWIVAHERVADALRNGRSVIFDATFAKVKQRREFIAFVRTQGVEKIEGVFVDVPLELALGRNKSRAEHGEKLVDEKAIIGMHRQLFENEPGTHDGFDAIFQVGADGQFIQIDLQREGNYLTKKFR